MQAEIRTLEDVFGSPVQLLVPLYQRPYVWDEGKQWEPLWEDVRDVAERLRANLAQGMSSKKAQAQVTAHFMGAVVLQEIHTAIGEMDRYTIIDGQQRLTTLQLLVGATHAALEKAGENPHAQLLAPLIANDQKVKLEEDRFKLWPTNNDRAAFREVMCAPTPVAHASLENAKARVVGAHQYFSARVSEWFAESPGADDRARRFEALTTVLLGMLKVVAIELGKDENAQLIFETLNARNTPLLASDLVKNVLFQRIEEDTPGKSEPLYEKHWKALDADAWRRTVRQGRLVRPRLDLFLYYWLIMDRGEEVTSHEVFPAIRNQLEESRGAVELLSSISANAARYDLLDKSPPGSVQGTFRYRVIDVMQADAVTPVLLWLHDPTRAAIPSEQVERALQSLESWAVRRMLCRMTTKGYNQVFLDLIKELGGAARGSAGDVIRAYLIKQTADARLWPTDGAVNDALTTTDIYRKVSRGRLRMVLEAVEDRLRTDYSEHNVDRGKLTIEHVLPQSWQKHWPIGDDAPAAARMRDHLLHTLGNLTLVTKKLNPKLSNGSWTDKRTGLGQHSVLRLNHALLAKASDPWEEAQIKARSDSLAAVVASIWPRPATATA